MKGLGLILYGGQYGMQIPAGGGERGSDDKLMEGEAA